MVELVRSCLMVSCCPCVRVFNQLFLITLTRLHVQRIVEHCQLRPNPFSIDLTTTATLASGLSERRIVCLTEEKDIYLYYVCIYTLLAGIRTRTCTNGRTAGRAEIV